MEQKREEIAGFYDEFAQQQKKTGVNIRHRSIMKRLRGLGLTHSHRVLEVGCGIGTLTSLLVKHAGHVIATDISPASIEMAKKNLASHSNLDCMVTDMSDFEVREKVDWIVCPDVLEHIPVEQHKSLFATLKKCLKPGGKICIHIPDPYALEWIAAHEPHTMQIIDQSLYTDLLTPSIYENGLAIHKLERYCLQATSPDYQWIEVIHRPKYESFSKKKYRDAVIDEVKSRI